MAVACLGGVAGLRPWARLKGLTEMLSLSGPRASAELLPVGRLHRVRWSRD